jgi:proteasome assembly chaperone (PAC2) family protein
MELASLLRPHVRYDDGVVESFEMHENEIFADVANKLVFFVGREPNMRWEQFGECVFDIARRAGVSRIIFMGSFGGAVPHTREPRMYGSVSDKALRPMLKHFGLRATEYEGPASFSTYLLTRAPTYGIEMLSIAAEIPGYLEGSNPLSIEAVARRIGNVLNLPVDLDELRKQSTEWEAQVSDAVAKDKGLAKTIRRLENEYDNDLVETMDVDE